MEQQFDINKVIEHYSLNEDDVAEALFPNIRYKIPALNRIRKKEASLNVEQLQALANLCGVLIGDLFNLDEWKSGYDKADNCFTLLRSDYVVKINYNGSYLVIIKNGKVINKSLMPSAMEFSKFIEYTNNIIKEYENGSNC